MDVIWILLVVFYKNLMYKTSMKLYNTMVQTSSASYLRRFGFVLVDKTSGLIKEIDKKGNLFQPCLVCDVISHMYLNGKLHCPCQYYQMNKDSPSRHTQFLIFFKGLLQYSSTFKNFILYNQSMSSVFAPQYFSELLIIYVMQKSSFLMDLFIKDYIQFLSFLFYVPSISTIT